MEEKRTDNSVLDQAAEKVYFWALPDVFTVDVWILRTQVLTLCRLTDPNTLNVASLEKKTFPRN